MKVTATIDKSLTVIRINDNVIFVSSISEKLEEFIHSVCMQYDSMIKSFSFRKQTYLNQKFESIYNTVHFEVFHSDDSDHYMIEFWEDINHERINRFEFTNTEMEEIIEKMLNTIYEYDKTIADIANNDYDKETLKYMFEFIEQSSLENFLIDFKNKGK